MSYLRTFIANIDRKSVQNVLFYMVLAAFVVPFTFSKIAAPDLFKALYTGRYIALFLEIPHHSEFTFSPVKPFFPAEAFNWLVNLMLYGLHQIGGYVGLQVFRVFIAFFFLVMAHSLMKFRTNPFSLLILVAMLYGAHQKFLMRNTIMLVPFGILLMWLWHQFRIKCQWRWGLAIPVLFLFWGNMHGTYLVGIGLLGLMVLGDVMDRLIRSDHEGWRWPLRGGVIVLVSLLIVVFVKPYPDYTVLDAGKRVFLQGEGGMVGSLWYGQSTDDPSSSQLGGNTINSDKNTTREAVTKKSSVHSGSSDQGGKREIKSWRLRWYLNLRHFLQNTVFDTSHPTPGGKDFPLSPAKPFMFTALAILIIIVTLGSFASTIRAFRFAEFLPFLVASVIGLGYIRTVALIPIIVMPILFMKFHRGDFDHLQFGDAIHVISLVVLLVLFGNMSYHLYFNDLQQFTNTYLHTGVGKYSQYSDKLPEYVLENYPDERMYNRYGLGTYLIWKWWPEKKVFADGKNLAYEPEHMRGIYYKKDAEVALEHGLSFMVLPIRDNTAFYRTIPDPKWEVVAFDLGMILFRHVGKDPTDADGRQVMLYTKEEFENLPRSNQVFLSAVAGFIDHYQNNPDHEETFTSPFQRYDRDIEELYNDLEIQ